jgi:hypothetical protein
MAPFDFVVPPRDSVMFRLVREIPPDPELTCLICHDARPLRACEWSMQIAAFGVRHTVGVHEACIAEHERRMKLDADRAMVKP